MPLQYLIFERSEGTDGLSTFDTMASVQAAHWPAVLREASQVLSWAHTEFGASQCQMDEPDGWDVDLQAQLDDAVPMALRFDLRSGRIHEQASVPGTGRHTLSLTLSGGPAFAEAFIEAFGSALSDAD